MKLKNYILYITLIFLSVYYGNAQVKVPFSPRLPGGSIKVKGDIKLVGNSIVNTGPMGSPANTPYVINSDNNGLNMEYIDIDSDASTFSSSSADLNIGTACKRIVYAGLYWSATYPYERSTDAASNIAGTPRITDFNTIKFKLPGGAYLPITADNTIFDGFNIDPFINFPDSPYVCYKDVTSLLQGLPDADGQYVVANVRSAKGQRVNGISAGWSLVVIYEDPTLPSKFISTFDGFAGIHRVNAPSVNVTINGFQTIPSGPVNFSMGVAALEGDRTILGDQFLIKANSVASFTPVGGALNPPGTILAPLSADFFNSTITNNDTQVLSRNPASTNTLGFDLDLVTPPNPSNSIIPNGETGAQLQFTTTTTNGSDAYSVFLTSFAVDIIEPKIILTKVVQDLLGNNIGGATVNLGDTIEYVIGFQNVGNDSATSFTIKDILPVNVVFNPATGLTLPSGATYTYNAGTRTLLFTVPNNLVEKGDSRSEIRIRVSVPIDCNVFKTACSKEIKNQAFASYKGVINTTQITDDPSLSFFSSCALSTPTATNFLANVSGCIYPSSAVLCSASVELTAASGYDSYSWSTSPTGIPVIGTNQTLTVTSLGTYYVRDTATIPCISTIDEVITVVDFNSGLTNPVIPYADQIPICPNDGKKLPLIFLCGLNDHRLIQTNTGALSVIWQKLDPTSCPPIALQSCANENATCTWNQVGTSPDFDAIDEGQYRVILNYAGGCFKRFYFNVFKNPLDPKFTVQDIICTTPGKITITNVPFDYIYSLDNPAGPYQVSPVFTPVSAGTHHVYIQQLGAGDNACLFDVFPIVIRAHVFTTTVTPISPLCFGDKGSIKVAAFDAQPQYTFCLYSGNAALPANLIQCVGPIAQDNYEFPNLNPGTYTVTINTQDGCSNTKTVTITPTPLLTATLALTKPLTPCSNGEITIYPVGGTPPYCYFINGNSVPQCGSNVISVPAPGGTYNIVVVDKNNCTFTLPPITVVSTVAPSYNIIKTDALCSGTSTGTITINVTNANGNAIQYSIDGGTTWLNSNVFNNLPAGNYTVMIKYVTGTAACTITNPITINNPNPITATVTLTTDYTCNSATGSSTNPGLGVITVTGVSGGTAPYTYCIGGTCQAPTASTTTTFTGLVNGNYTITIKDANGCSKTFSKTITPLNPPTNLTFSATALTCPANTTTVTINNVTGGVSPFQYQIVAAPPAFLGSLPTLYQNSKNFSGLPPGTYTFQVIDSKGCTFQKSFTIPVIPPIKVVGTLLNNIVCFGTNSGNIRFTVTNPGTTGYTYTINGGASIAGPGSGIINLTNLATGAYVIIVKSNQTTCTDTATITVVAPPSALAITKTVTPISCTNNGSVVINASGGWGSYSYTLTPPSGPVIGPQLSNSFTNLSTVGLYTITVKDSNGCTVSDTFTLVAPATLTSSISAASDFCYDGTNAATIIITASGGVAPLTYNINGGLFDTNNIFANLTPGSYTIKVKDAAGCELTLPMQTIASQLTISSVLTKGIDCTVSPNAVITNTIAGGYPPYTYKVNSNAGGYPAGPGTATSTPFTFPTAIAGTFQFQITDSKGCVAQSNTITVDPIVNPVINSVIQTQQILCGGDATATINVNIDTTKGVGPFVINVFNNTTSTNYGTQTSSLPAGNYTITVTDANSCTNSKPIAISQPVPIAFTEVLLPITCTGSGTTFGSISVTGLTGGIAPYTYILTNNVGDPTQTYVDATGADYSFTVLNFGIYELDVVDSNNCSVKKQNIVMSSPPSDLTINASILPSTCAAGGTIIVEVAATFTGGPYHFAIYQSPYPPFPDPAYQPADAGFLLQSTFTGLTPGVTYSFVVYDETTQCYYFKTADTPVLSLSNLTSTVTPKNVTCKGNADGNVSFTFGNYNATSVSYTIYNSLTNTAVVPSVSGTIPGLTGLPTSVSNEGPLAPGTYYILFTENDGANAGCTKASSAFTITESATLLSITASEIKKDNCNLNAGIISATGQGGTAPLTYQILLATSPAPTAVSTGWSATNNTLNTESGNYVAYVKDANNCIASFPVIVGLDPTPVITATVTNQCTATGSNFSIDVVLTTVGIAPYTVIIDGAVPVTKTFPFTITNLSPGLHTVQIKDANGCGNTVSNTIYPELILSASFTTLPTCLNNDGTITAIAAGGSGAYTYSLFDSTGTIPLVPAQPSPVFPAQPTGSYQVEVVDTNTLCSKSMPISLVLPTAVTFTTAPSPVSCNGGANGSITVILPVSNDNPNYLYETIAPSPIIFAPQSSNIFAGLTAGTYTIKVTSGRGCSLTQPETITEPSPLTANGSATSFGCASDNSVNTSTLTITESGGTSPYKYSIDGSSYFTTNIFDITDTGAIQNITVYVQDDNGCIATNTVIINPLPKLTSATVAIATPIDCNNTGSVSISVTGGSGNFNYQLLPSGIPQPSNTFSISTPGDYYFQVNDLTTGCHIETLPYTVLPYNTIDVVATTTSDVICFGDANGTIEINVTGYSGAYSYNVFNGVILQTSGIGNTSTNPLPITGLPSGNYTVEVTETVSPFCVKTSNLVIIESPIAPLTLSASETSNVTCDNNKGTITAIATGGWGILEYQLIGPISQVYSSNSTFIDLVAGTYTINVKDTKGCTQTKFVTLTTPNPINATVTPSVGTVACNGDKNASINITNVTGGQGSNYTYTLNTILPTPSSSGPQSTPIFDGLGAGTYNVTVQDGYNCIYTSVNIVIGEPSIITVDLKVATNQSCFNQTTLTLTASGGTPPYTYSADGISYSAGTFNPSITFAVPVGTYHYYVKDNNGCMSFVSNDINIDPLTPLSLTTNTETNLTINCTGESTGVINVSAQGALGNYVYTLLNGVGVPIATEPSQGPTVTANFTGLIAGTYIVRVMSGDCSLDSTVFTISEPTTPITATYTLTDVSCNGANNGKIVINASGGTGIIRYAISPQRNQFFTTSTFDNLAPGNYDVIVQDENGCIAPINFDISEPTPVAVTMVSGSLIPEICKGDNDGEFSIDISGGTLPYSVSLDNPAGVYTTGTPTQTQFDFTGLGGGDHKVYIRDANLCNAELPISLPASVKLDPQAIVDYSCVNNAPSNTVTVTVDASITNPADVDYALDGIPPYQASNVFTNVSAGTHFISARHTNGCIQQTQNFTILQINPLAVILINGGLNEIVATTTGGSGIYHYTFNGESTGTSNTYIYYKTGVYTVEVVDSEGCTATDTKPFTFIDIEIPNVFTPNNDGNNDTWGPTNTRNYPDLIYHIFDRYGRKVGTYREGQFWDGKYNGLELPSGDYWYVLKLNNDQDGREFMGHFTLYR
ncbi:MAG: T9SS type B sorting domain-containing protein [Flavobacterium sp.]|uniref:T9SS type B sorting domain-containing protein n=1 Tax=Flavobacterium sp. TaxID=239 RepID=UPI00261713B6|nr:T9SS type B sorting domain-containing protein [Flavobacterium sp.]MDD5148925.1 T9SS type B sorting domain-containing protein [Flavobacterium sp.]